MVIANSPAAVSRHPVGVSHVVFRTSLMAVSRISVINLPGQSVQPQPLPFHPRAGKSSNFCQSDCEGGPGWSPETLLSTPTQIRRQEYFSIRM